MSNLIDSERALANLNGQTLTGEELDILDVLIAAASQAIEAHCRRAFASADYDERHDGQDDAVLLLNHYPVIALDRVACEPTTVMRVANTATDTQRATVRVSAEGLTLTRVVAGVASSDSLLFADSPSLGELATAINALGDGWSATGILADHSGRASADLGACPGLWAARTAEAELRLHLRELNDYRLDPRIGVLRRPLGWPGGASAIRVVYVAGFTEVPADVQEACAQLVAQMFWQTRRDPGLAQESVLSAVTRRPVEGWPQSIRDLLAPHRRVPRL